MNTATRSCRVTIVMPAFNAARFIRDAITSLLSQTYGDFELIVINDGSTDETPTVVRTFSDRRIRLIDNSKNLGLTAVRNEGLAMARGEYLAWLDSDDISAPGRLGAQVRLLDRFPELGACGTWVETFGSNRRARWRYPSDPDTTRSRLLFDSPMATSSVMMRKSVIDRNELTFEPEYPPAEDYDFWERLSTHSSLTNIPAFLTFYRIHESQSSTLQKEKQARAVAKVQGRQLSRLGINPTSSELEIHGALGRWNFGVLATKLTEVEAWLLKLAQSNEVHSVYPRTAFRRTLTERWFHACLDSGLGLFQASERFFSSEARFSQSIDLKTAALFAARTLKRQFQSP